MLKFALCLIRFKERILSDKQHMDEPFRANTGKSSPHGIPCKTHQTGQSSISNKMVVVSWSFPFGQHKTLSTEASEMETTVYLITKYRAEHPFSPENQPPAIQLYHMIFGQTL
jgi:hypothetical protein